MYRILKYMLLMLCTNKLIEPIIASAVAQEASRVDGMTVTKLSNGLNVTKVQGLYRYKAGGVPLFGYIQKSEIEYKSADKVSFVVCNTGSVIMVTYGDLNEVDQNCPSIPINRYPETPASIFQEWNIKSGKFVAIQKPGAITLSRTQTSSMNNLNISDLPKDYQAVISGQSSNGPAAVTFSVPNTGTLLGIVEKKGL